MEDIPYGLVPMTFGKLAKVRTPTIDLIIDLACLLAGVDFGAKEDTGDYGLAQEDSFQDKTARRNR